MLHLYTIKLCFKNLNQDVASNKNIGNNNLLFDIISSCHLLDKVKHNIITKPNCDGVKSHSNSVRLQYIIGNIMCITD